MTLTFTTDLPAPSSLTVDDKGSSYIDLSWVDNSTGEVGFRVYYREKGASGWTQFSTLGENVTLETVDSLSSDVYELYVDTYTEHTASDSSIVEAETYLDAVRSISSHILTSGSNVSTLIDLHPTTNSYGGPLVTSSLRTIGLLREVASHSNPMSAGTARSAVSYGPRGAASHMRKSYLGIFNDRTSLELLDYDLTWDSEEVAWYTPWDHEEKILGSEDTLAVRALIADGAEEPAATITVQYSTDGNSVSAEGTPINTGSGEKVYEITDLPTDGEGWYRMKITNHSGYNEVYSLDMGLIHR